MRAPSNPSIGVYLSYRDDLTAYAEAAISALYKGQISSTYEVMITESTADFSVARSKQKVLEADVLIVLIGRFYGWVPSVKEGGDGIKSIGWIELETAVANKKPILLYIQTEHIADSSTSLNKKTLAKLERDRLPLVEFRKYIDSLGFFWNGFAMPADLAETVQRTFNAWANGAPILPKETGNISTPAGCMLLKINGRNWPIERVTAAEEGYFSTDDFEYAPELYVLKNMQPGQQLMIYDTGEQAAYPFLLEITQRLQRDEEIIRTRRAGKKQAPNRSSVTSTDNNDDDYEERIRFLLKMRFTQPIPLKLLVQELGLTSIETNTLPELLAVDEAGLARMMSQFAMPSSPEKEKEQDDQLKNCLHSDEYNVNDEDILGYDLHASNLFNILIDQQTNPPLNIGILAPWGRGKTSLMRKVEHMFIEERRKHQQASHAQPATSRPMLKDLRAWLNSKEALPGLNKIPFATVWFNPWNYQSSEMIWAGMADAIVAQVVDQMPDEIAKENFWFRLRLARIDKEELRKELQLRVVFYLLQFLAWGLVALLVVAMILLKMTGHGAFLGELGVGAGFGAIVGVAASVASYLKPNKKDIADVFEKYTKAPQYLNKLGTFHEVQEDLKKVFDLLVSEAEPLVIFVDDLDRCSPSKVVEVVEAINVFISGEHRKKCYFVLGMDAEIVAASLDVAYEKMKGKIINRETEQGSLGWYFLDKFIQLPFFIPVINEQKKEEYLKSLLRQSAHNRGEANDGPAAQQAGKLNEVQAKEVAIQVMAAKTPEESKELMSKYTGNVAAVKELDKAILKQQVEENHDHEAISEQVARYGKYLNSDPRSLKRFANLLRFYNSYQVLRMKKGQPFVPIHYLSKYLALMLKFPQLIRWIQWDTESKNGLSTSADLKARLIDDAIGELILLENHRQNFSYWYDAASLAGLVPIEKLSVIIKMQEDMPWLKSQSLVNILLSDEASEAPLNNALNCNVW